MMATAAGRTLAVPTGLAVGLAVGILNGLGIAYLRVPAMIFTDARASWLPIPAPSRHRPRRLT
jgi:ribose/xylose/arabinose/galactoside ABC-type transport system permease subunit